MSRSDILNLGKTLYAVIFFLYFNSPSSLSIHIHCLVNSLLISYGDYRIYWARRVSRITFIKYANNQTLEPMMIMYYMPMSVKRHLLSWIIMICLVSVHVLHPNVSKTKYMIIID
jgi:hypothetical protein